MLSCKMVPPAAPSSSQRDVLVTLQQMASPQEVSEIISLKIIREQEPELENVGWLVDVLLSLNQ